MALMLDDRPRIERPAPVAPSRDVDPARWIAVVAASLLAFGLRGPVTAAALAVALVVHPGVLFVRSLRPRDRLETMVVVIATSVTAWMVVAHLMLTFRWWYPDVVAAGVLGVCALARAGQRRRPAPVLAAVDWGSFMHWQLACSVLALALWDGAMSRLDVADIGLLGLVAELPVMWFAGFAVATVGAAVAATAPRTSATRLVVAVVPLLVFVYGTVAASIGTIRYPWAYKHIGVMRLLDETGRLHPQVDIYNNFSGFFGLGALVRGATGVDPTSYAAWAQLVGEAFVLLAVGFLVLRVTESVRVTYLAVVVYLLTNWVGQNYFAAQTVASFLALTMLGLVWSWFHVGRASTTRPPSAAPPSPAPPSRATTARRRIAVAAVFLGLVMTHPLTPIVVIGALGIGVVLGVVRDRRLVVAVAVVGICWALRVLPYFAGQSFDLGFGGSPTDNASGNTDVSAAPAQALLISRVTQLFSMVVWLLAAVGVAMASWARRRIGALIVLAAIPFGIPLVQSYGGEAIYRVYLYSLPLVAAMIAWGVVSSTPVARRRLAPQPTVLASVLCLALAAGFVVVHYGRERINQVDRSEVVMDRYFHETTAGPAFLAQFAAGYPAQSGATYPEFQVTATYTPYVVEMLGPREELPPPFDLEDVADALLGLRRGTPYIAVSPGMIDELAVLGTFPVSSSEEATAFLLSNPRFELLARIDDTYLVEVAR